MMSRKSHVRWLAMCLFLQRMWKWALSYLIKESVCRWPRRSVSHVPGANSGLMSQHHLFPLSWLGTSLTSGSHLCVASLFPCFEVHESVGSPVLLRGATWPARAWGILLEALLRPASGSWKTRPLLCHPCLSPPWHSETQKELTSISQASWHIPPWVPVANHQLPLSNDLAPRRGGDEDTDLNTSKFPASSLNWHLSVLL